MGRVCKHEPARNACLLQKATPSVQLEETPGFLILLALSGAPWSGLHHGLQSPARGAACAHHLSSAREHTRTGAQGGQTRDPPLPMRTQRRYRSQKIHLSITWRVYRGQLDLTAAKRILSHWVRLQGRGHKRHFSPVPRPASVHPAIHPHNTSHCLSSARITALAQKLNTCPLVPHQLTDLPRIHVFPHHSFPGVPQGMLARAFGQPLPCQNNGVPLSGPLHPQRPPQSPEMQAPAVHGPPRNLA